MRLPPTDVDDLEEASHIRGQGVRYRSSIEAKSDKIKPLLRSWQDRIPSQRACSQIPLMAGGYAAMSCLAVSSVLSRLVDFVGGRVGVASGG